MADFTPSVYQQAILSEVRHGTGHLVLMAAPGSGKTSTQFLIAEQLRQMSQEQRRPHPRTLYVAFNKSVVEEAEEKRKAIRSPMTIRTLNAFGNGLLIDHWRRVLHRPDKPPLVSGKYRKLIKERLLPGTKAAGSDEIAEDIATLADYTRMTLTPPTERGMLDLIEHFGLDIEPDDLGRELWTLEWQAVQDALALGKQGFLSGGPIDYVDQYWLPLALRLPIPQFDYVLADEAQDFNKAMTALILAAGGKHRLIFTGDRNQAIYGFSGADTESMEHIIAATHAKVLPLAECFRCPAPVVDLAYQIFPDIEKSPKAPQGCVRVLPKEELEALARQHAGEILFLCRTNAPLVEMCLAFLREGLHATMRGTDLGRSFVSLIDKISKQRGCTWDQFEVYAQRYLDKQVRLLEKKPDTELRIANLQDRVATLFALLHAYQQQEGLQSKESFKAYVSSFFVDEANQKNVVVFSTIHKAKGLEYPYVVILETGLIPHKAAKLAWEKKQELHCAYIAITRAQQELIFTDTPIPLVNVPGWEEPDPQPGLTIIAARSGRQVEMVSISAAERPALLPSPVIEVAPASRSYTVELPAEIADVLDWMGGDDGRLVTQALEALPVFQQARASYRRLKAQGRV